MSLQQDPRVVFSGSKHTAQSWVRLDNAPRASLVCRLFEGTRAAWAFEKVLSMGQEI